MARLVVGAVGAVVGFYLGGPVGAFQGFALAYGVTGFLDPNSKVLGPKLLDLKAPQASYGSPIPYIEGSPRLAGVFFWASEKQEVASTSTQGKGGPGVDSTSFSYVIDVLIGLSTTQCTGLRRVWSNGALVWSQADDADSETFAASGVTNAWRDIRFYSGAATQMPDPVYEAAVGVGNAPAYRGRTTVFIEGLNLGGSGQLPVLTFEVGAPSGTEVVTFADVPAGLNADSQGQGATTFATAGYQVHIGQWYDTFANDVIVYDVSATGDVALAGTYSVVTTASQEAASDGSTDTPGILRRDAFNGNYNDVYWYESVTGIGHQFKTTGGTSTVASHDVRFCLRGDDLVLGYDEAGTSLKIFRFSKMLGLAAFISSGGTPNAGAPASAVSTARAHPIKSIVHDGTTVYAALRSTRTIEVFDLATLTLSGTITGPGSGAAPNISVLLLDESDTLHWLDDVSNSLYSWDGSAWTLAIGGLTVYPSGFTQWGLTGGVLKAMTKAAPDTERIHEFYPSFATVAPGLDEVVSRLCLRTKQLTTSDIDVTDLAGVTVRGFAISQVGPTRTTLEMLMGAYLFGVAEDDKLRFKLRGAAPALSIPYADLAAGHDTSGEPLQITRRNDAEVPALVSVRYANVLNDFQDGLESGDRLVTESNAVTVVEAPLGLTPTEAKRLADANTMDAAVGIVSIGPIALTRKYAALQPTDVVLLTGADGSIYRARIVKHTAGTGVATMELALDDATAIVSEAETDSTYVASTLIRLLSETEMELLDIPILRDADDDPGIYAAFNSSGRWPGAELDKSLDNVSYGKVLDTATRATMGEATTVLGDFTGGTVFDEVSTVTVDVGDGTLASSTRTALLTTDANAMLIGDEIVQFRDADLDSPGVYVLTGFLRGRRGTEWAIPGHVADERVVLLEADTLRRVTDSAADIGIPYYWKAVTHGKSRADTTAEVFTDTGVGLMPFSPVDLRVSDSGSQDIQLDWLRRTRLETRFVGTGGISTPLGELTEAYEVDVFDGVTLVRTITATTPTITYTSAQQATDGVDSGSSLTFTVYQISATVGRGYGASTAADGRRSPLPQISQITLGGSYVSGAAIYVVIGSTRFDYTSTVPDATLGGIATSLASLIDAHADYTAAAVGSVVTITGLDSVSEPLTAGQNAGDNTITFSTTQTASPIVAGHREEYNYQILWANSGAIDPATSVSLHATRISDGLNRYYTGTAGTSNAAFASGAVLSGIHTAFVASGDRAAFDLDNAQIDDISSRFFTPLADPFGWDVELVSAYANAQLGVGRRGVGIVDVPAARSQISTITLAGTPATGRIYSAILGGVTYSYTAGGGDTTMTLVAVGLAAVIDAAAAYSATSVGAVITVTGSVVNTPFIYSGSITVHSVTVAASITQTAN